jgi:RNA polymerase sigma factor (sigma-70 family)
VAHSQLPGFIQGIARMTGNNEASRLNLRGKAGRRREVVLMADWPAPDPQDWQAPVSVTPHQEAAHQENVEWTPPTWEELVRDHGARVYRLAYRLTGNPHDAEDLTQDVFVRVFRSLHRFQPGTFEGWLHRITTNLFLDGARRRQKIRFDGLGEGSDERLPSAWPSPSEQLADADLDHDVAAALSALPPEFRAAVVLCDIEGLTYEEISEVLDIKIGTVRSRIHRGRAQLRAALAHRRPTGERLRYLGVEVESGEIPDSVAPRLGATSQSGSLEPVRST